MKIVACGGQRKDRSTQSAQLVSALVSEFDRSYEQNRELASLPPDCNLYVQYGFKGNKSLQAAIENNIPFVCLDRGYFANRPNRFSVSINGFHGLSMQASHVWGLMPREHPPIEPRRTPGEFVYLYGQLPGDRALRGIHIEAWLRREAQTASEATGLPCKIRPHPLTISSWEPPLPPLSSTFDDAFCGVFWTSTATVQAALAGVNCVALHPANPAYNVCAHSYAELDGPRIMTRQEWVHDLSHRQYRFSEIDRAAQYIRAAYGEAETHAVLGNYDTLGLRP